MTTDIDRAQRQVEKARKAVEGGDLRGATVHLWNAAFAHRLPVSERELVAQVVELADEIQGSATDEQIRTKAKGISDDYAHALRPTPTMTPEEEASRIVTQRGSAITESRRTRDVASSRTFEYSILDLGQAEAGRRLAEAGILGWELVAVMPGAEGRERLYFKREVWTHRDEAGNTTAAAPRLGPSASAAATGGGGFFALGYYESGLDLDADGDVDGGLIDSIQDLFG